VLGGTWEVRTPVRDLGGRGRRGHDEDGATGRALDRERGALHGARLAGHPGVAPARARDDDRRARPAPRGGPALHDRGDRVRDTAARSLADDVRVPRGVALVHGGRRGMPLRDDLAAHAFLLTGTWYRGRRGRHRRP
jgi:hypothetical protein